MNRRTRTMGQSVALIGLNHPHALLLLRTLENLAGISTVDVWATNVRELRGVSARTFRKVRRRTRRLNDILNDRSITVAIVCVPTCDMIDLAMRVVRAGKHVLLDKPVSVRRAPIARLARLARARGLQTSVLYGQRCHPAVAYLRRMIGGGALGRILSVEARLVTTQVRFREPKHWLFSRAAAGGGVLAWLGCHYLDLLAYVCGDPIAEVSATIGTVAEERIDVENVGAMTLRFASGAIGSLHAGYLLAHSGSGYGNRAGFDSRLAIQGTHGRAVWGGATRPSLYLEHPGPDGKSVRRRVYFRQRKTNSYGGATGENFVRAFLAAVKQGTPPPCPLDDAAQTSAVLEAAYVSARTGRTCRVNPRS